MWSIVQVGWRSVAQFIVFAVLIRNLSLAEVGIFALATTYVEIVRVFSGAGLSDAVQREPDLDDEMLDTAFWGGLGISVVTAVLMAFGAVIYAAAVGNDQVAPIIYAMAVLMVVSSISKVQWALHLRVYRHKLLTYQTMIATVIGGIGAVIAVKMGAGIWALLVQSIATEAVGMALAWFSSDWRPRLRFSPAAFKRLMSFGGGMVATRLLWTVLARVPDLVIGRMIGVDAVGTYRVAWRLVDLLGAAVLTPLAKVVFNVFAQLQRDLAAFERAYCRVLGLGSLLLVPAVVGFGAVASDLIPLLFGERVRASIPIAEVLAFSAPVFVANYFISSAMTAVGKPFVMVRVAVIQLVSTVILAVASAPFGLLAVTIAYVVRGYLTLPYQQYVLHKNVGISYRRVIDTMTLPIIGSIAMVVAIVLAKTFLLPANWPGAVRVAILVTGGAAVYFGLVALIGLNKIKDQAEFVLSILRKKDKSKRGEPKADDVSLV